MNEANGPTALGMNRIHDEYSPGLGWGGGGFGVPGTTFCLSRICTKITTQLGHSCSNFRYRSLERKIPISG